MRPAVAKVGVREEVLVKAKKLYPYELESIESRFQLIVQLAEKHYLQKKLKYLKANGRKGFDEYENYLDRDPEVKCYLPGVPRATYMPHPLRIQQGEDAIMIMYQYANAVREIYLEDIGEAPVDSWMGQSVGRWEGDTLVVEVTGQNDQTWFDRAGNHHSAQMTVTERYTPMGPNHLLYEATIDDPETFTRPWTMRMPLYRRMEPDARLLDFRCVEFVEELLYGEWRRHPLERP